MSTQKADLMKAVYNLQAAQQLAGPTTRELQLGAARQEEARVDAVGPG